MEYVFYIIWNANPEIISGIPPRWYGLLFASGFLIGSYIMRWMYKLDGRDPEEVERLTLYMVIATIVGARVGHCLFYDPVYYLSNPLKNFIYMGRRTCKSWRCYFYYTWDDYLFKKST